MKKTKKPAKQVDKQEGYTRWMRKLGKEKLSLAEKLCGRKFTNDADLIAALQSERCDGRENFMAEVTRLFGFEFTTLLEVFRAMIGEHLTEFEALAPPEDSPSMFQIAETAFTRSFRTPKDLYDFIAQDPKRDGTLNEALIAAGWRSKKKQPAERMTLKKADELFSAFVFRIAKANSNRKFAFFLQEALVYGSYMNRENDTVGDIDIAISFAMKTRAKLDTRIAFYMRKDGVDWKGGYDRAINEVSESIVRSKRFHQADVEYVKRSFPYRIVYEMPEQEQYIRVAMHTQDRRSVEHLHEFLESAELRRSRKGRGRRG
jgi:hypothetical protein